MSIEKSITEYLGGTSIIKKEINELGDFLELIRDGLPIKSAASVIKHSGFPQEVVLKQIGISKATYARKRKTPSSKLEPTVSDRIFRIAYMYARAETIFGDYSISKEWMHRANRSLKNRMPFELLDTEVGSKEVERLLTQIEYGDYD